ncbi:MAG: D-glycero-alpha-D-manno-heptose-1,7-bisphosphate 7-phosphatase [Limisphaerales bacterium]
MKVAVFFERDGVLTHAAGEEGAVRTPHSLEEFRVREDVRESLADLKAAGFLLFATTNQPGVTSGAPTRRELDLMHAVLMRKLELDSVLICPHPSDDPCTCRKPLPGLLREAAHEFKLDLEHSFVVSDRWEDAEMADAVGATSVLIRSKANGNGHHDYVVPDFRSAVAKVLDVARDLGILGVLSEQRS